MGNPSVAVTSRDLRVGRKAKKVCTISGNSLFYIVEGIQCKWLGVEMAKRTEKRKNDLPDRKEGGM
jgi:hypothetical protein